MNYLYCFELRGLPLVIKGTFSLKTLLAMEIYVTFGTYRSILRICLDVLLSGFKTILLRATVTQLDFS